MDTQQDDTCCLSTEEFRPDDPRADTGKTTLITDGSRFPPVEMTVVETKSSETDKSLSLGEKITKSPVVEKTPSDDSNYLKSSYDVLRDSKPAAATPVKIETSEETHSTDLCKKTYDVAEKQEDVIALLSVRMKDEEKSPYDLCTTNDKAACDQNSKKSQCIPPVEKFETKKNELGVIHGEKRQKINGKEETLPNQFTDTEAINIISRHDSLSTSPEKMETPVKSQHTAAFYPKKTADHMSSNTNKHQSNEILNESTFKTLPSEDLFVPLSNACRSVSPKTIVQNKETARTESKNSKKMQDVDPQSIRIVLIGQTGTGKSATGNTILGKEKFRTDSAFVSCTSKPQKESCKIDGLILEVIDTPGLYDTSKTEELVKQDLKLCLEMTSPGPHVFLIILSVGRITEQEKHTLKYMSEMFGDEDFLNHTIMVITRKEDLDSDYDSDDDDEDYDISEKLKTFIRDSEDLTRIVKQCGDRCLAVSNSGLVDSNNRKREADRLIQSVFQLIDQNEGICYSNDMFKELERQKDILRKEEEVRKQKLIEKYEKEENERKTEMKIRKEYVRELERKIEEMTIKLEDEQLKSGSVNLELKRELEELKAENKEMNRRINEKIEELKRKIKNIDIENEDYKKEIMWRQRKKIRVNSRSKSNSICRIM